METSPSTQIGWLLLFAGIVLVFLGALLLAGPSLRWLGRLPGDIRIEHDNFRFYFPITTSILLSVVASALLWLIQRLNR